AAAAHLLGSSQGDVELAVGGGGAAVTAAGGGGVGGVENLFESGHGGFLCLDDPRHVSGSPEPARNLRVWAAPALPPGQPVQAPSCSIASLSSSQRSSSCSTSSVRVLSRLPLSARAGPGKAGSARASFKRACSLLASAMRCSTCLSSALRGLACSATRWRAWACALRSSRRRPSGASPLGAAATAAGADGTVLALAALARPWPSAVCCSRAARAACATSLARR